MSRTNEVLIGAFVLGALLLVLAAVLLLGGERWWRPLPNYLVEFDESVKGLRRGAAVTFRGVPVGSVRDIGARVAPDTGEARVAVLVEIDPRAVAVDEAGGLDALLDRGLSAQLELESLLTGQLQVALDLREGVAPLPPGPDGTPRIPAVPSAMAEIQRSVERLAMDLPATLARVDRVLGRVERLLADDNLENARRLLEASAQAASRLGTAAGQLGPLLDEFRTTASTARSLLEDLRQRVPARDEQLAGALAGVAGAAREMREMAREIRLMVAENRGNIEAFTSTGLPLLTGLVEDADRMVNELYATLRDLRQDPARFFFGNRVSEGVPP